MVDGIIVHQLELFFYWINERHHIYLDRQEGLPWPWTDDKILQQYKFTNYDRELDVGTVWLRENWREPYADHEELFLNICLYRQINYWPTCKEIGYQEYYDPEYTEDVLRSRKERGEQIYTNAHMLTGTLGGDKITQTVYKVLLPLYQHIEDFEPIPGIDTLQSAFNKLNGNTPGFGPFISYEVVTDLRHTRYLKDAFDIMTWANPGPGAMRGINRLLGFPIRDDAGKQLKVKCLKSDEYISIMQHLLKISPKYLEDHVPDLEMRDIEHSLCEFDKYSRVLNNEGRPRLKFIPPHLRS